MIFHVACSLTCKKICFCDLGFRSGLKNKKGRKKFSVEVEALETFLQDAWTMRIDEETGTVQVPMPRIVRQADEDELAAMLQRQALEAKAAKEDYFRRLETGGVDLELEEAHSSHGKEELGSSSVKVMCRICFSGENEGSTKALKMLSCKSCDNKYHRNCIKSWAENRDLFHWSSWQCPSCRICEVCQSVGDPSKLMFCRRCDGAYHCYCQTPPHKNVGHGTYVCAKHTRCHSCGSTVPGNGPSTRWFLGYTCCDACGRLFVKGNYCPVCLKVYRDSEMTPMVCCDICESWIHCSCDGISDEKYQQFQSDQNLQYTCAACRGDCYQVKDTDDAVRELWRRKDEYDRKLIACLRANAGLPSQEDASSCVNTEQNYSMNSKQDHERPLKFSVKGSSDRNMSNNKELDKPTSIVMLPTKIPVKKYMKFIVNAEESYEKHNTVKEIQQLDNDLYLKTEVQNEVQTIQDMHYNESAAKIASKSENAKGSRLVIHLGSKTKNLPSTPKSEASICHKEQITAVTHGYDGIRQLKSVDNNNQMHETFNRNEKGLRRNSQHEYEEGPTQPFMTSSKQRKSIGKYTNSSIIKDNDEDIILTKKKQPTSSSIGLQSSRLKIFSSAVSSDVPKDPKPLLKLKFKTPYFEQKNSWASKGEEVSIVKGLRSKRKRTTTIIKESFSRSGGENRTAINDHSQNLLTNQKMEANWILQKLGKDAIGKKVEVHQPSDNSWKKGIVADVTIQEGDTTCSALYVIYDDGKTTNLDLEMRAVRFASQKHHKKAKSKQ